MVTKRVKAKDRVRDIERTREKLFAVVGDLLAQKDYKGITAARLAAGAGMGKNIVYDTFGSVPELLMAYIRKVDHWRPFFERFGLPDNAIGSQIRQMFILLMQDNFKRLHANKAMQDLILWQFYGESPLLRTVSEARELEGAKLLRLTDPHFKDSGISFRAVIALLLEGCYGLVLHGGNNRSSVCGIDINNERDWQLVYRSLSELIDCVWERAEGAVNAAQKTKLTKTMNYELVYLEELAAELSGRKLSAGAEPDERLVREAKKVERILLNHVLNAENETQIRMRLQVNMQTVVAVCDQLYDASREDNPDAEVVLGLLEELRIHLNAFIPGSLSIPRIFRERENKAFQQRWQQMKVLMEAAAFPGELLDLMALPFERFADRRERLEWDDFKYLRKYSKRMAITLALPSLSVQLVLNTLVGLGFNEARFLNYYFERMQDSLEGLPPEETGLSLRNYRREVQQVIELTNMRYDHYKKPVVAELTKWIDAELHFYSLASSM